MIENVVISGIHAEADEDLKKYIIKKIGSLDRYIAKDARESAHVEVRLKEHHIKDKKNCTCEVVLHLPQQIITTKESTLNMYAAVDIVEAKLRNQLMHYKSKHLRAGIRRRWFTRYDAKQ